MIIAFQTIISLLYMQLKRILLERNALFTKNHLKMFDKKAIQRL